MSVPLSMMPSGLVFDPGVTLTAVKVWHAIYVETLGRAGWDFTYQQLADRVGVKRRQTVMEAVDWLVEKGWLLKAPQTGQRGQDIQNRYTFCREPFVPWNEEDVRSSAQGGVRSTAHGGALNRTAKSEDLSTVGSALERTHQENYLPGEEQDRPPSEVPSHSKGDGGRRSAGRGSSGIITSLLPTETERQQWAKWVIEIKNGSIRTPLRYPWAEDELRSLVAQWQQQKRQQAERDRVWAVAARLYPDEDDRCRTALHLILTGTSLLGLDEVTDEASLAEIVRLGRCDLARLIEHRRYSGIAALAARLGVDLPPPDHEPVTFRWDEVLNDVGVHWHPVPVDGGRDRRALAAALHFDSLCCVEPLWQAMRADGIEAPGEYAEADPQRFAGYLFDSGRIDLVEPEQAAAA